MHSLQGRLSIGLTISLLIVILISWIAFSNTVRYVAEDYVITRLQHDGELLLAALEFDKNQNPVLLPDRISKEYQRAFSGHYYLIDINGKQLRSRSLWDVKLVSPLLAAGESRQLRIEGPQQQQLLVLVSGYLKQEKHITITVAEDLSVIEDDIVIFQHHFAIVAILILVVLVSIQLYIIRTALHPLKNTSKEIRALEHGKLNQLSQSVPAEISPLVNEVNHLLQVLDQRLQRSRNALGNLAHALKKPLTVIQQIGCADKANEVQQTLETHTREMQQLIERELRRARIAGEGPTGAYFVTDMEIKPLLDTLQSIYHKKPLNIKTDIPTSLVLPFDREDILELLGVLMDNACKWANKTVYLALHVDKQLTIKIDDDGPGVSDELMTQLTHRGKRLDETVSGYGLGLAIAQDIIEQYSGTLVFSRSETLGGFCVTVKLPLDKA